MTSRAAPAIAALCLLAACARQPAPTAAAVLLFAGKGASPGDVAAIEALLSRSHIAYQAASSPQLNHLSESQLRAYRLLIVPGGNFIDMGQSLTPVAATRVRAAVGDGLNYLGFCAGAFLASDSGYTSFNLTGGVRFHFYSAEAAGLRKAAVRVTPTSGPALDHYWEDGPQLTGWGSVVARYPDATPAIVESNVGKGFVLITGTHPEAPETWRHGLAFTSTAAASQAYAQALIQAALTATPLPHD